MRSQSRTARGQAPVKPLVDEWDWQHYAACRGKDAAMFFAPDLEGRTHREQGVASARAICATCPVQSECLTHARTGEEAYGI